MRLFVTAVVMLILSAAAAAQEPCTRTYTLDADFDEGVGFHVNHNAPNNDQLQLDPPPESGNVYPFIWIACSDRNTVVRVDVNTGEVLGEYLSMPVGRFGNPSRTTVDRDGNVWVSNRNETAFLNGYPQGAVVKIGLVIGGTRVDKDGTPNPDGQYLKPPFTYSTAVDRDGDGLIRTSRGLHDTLAWPDVTDGRGGLRGLVEDAEDECILIYQRLPNAPNPRHCSVDNDNHVWVGGYPNTSTSLKRFWFHKLDNSTGAIIRSINVGRLLPGSEDGPGGYGGLVDRNGVMWSTNPAASTLMKYDTRADTGAVLNMNGAYGIAMDPANGDLWVSGKVDVMSLLHSDGGRYDGFPVPSGGRTPKGVVVTKDGDVWVANNTTGNVTRLNRAGEVLTTIEVDSLPTGVAVDANGKIWVTNYASDNAMRIDPKAANNKLGAVDMTVDLGDGAGPYNYSDMTGAHVVEVTGWAGAWTVVKQSCNPDRKWGRIAWTADVPAGGALTVAARGSDDDGWTDLTALNGVNLCALPEAMFGDSIEVRVAFTGDTVSGQSPVLYDLTIEQCPETGDVQCAVNGDNALIVESYAYQPDPSIIRCRVYNNGSAPIDTAEVEIQLPAYITTSDPLSKPLSRIGPGGSVEVSWPLSALTSAYERQAIIRFVTRGIAGQELASCAHALFLPAVDALTCETLADMSFVYNETTGSYMPNPLLASLGVDNHLDTALTNIEIVASFSSPDLSVTGGSDSVQIASLEAQGNFNVVWSLLLDQVNGDSVITVTYTIRCDQYPEGRLCSFDVKVPPKRITYCADCTLYVVDTIWSNPTNEIIMPNPFHAVITLENTCTGMLYSIGAEFLSQPGVSLIQGETPIKSLTQLSPGELAVFSWELEAMNWSADSVRDMFIRIIADDLPDQLLCSQPVAFVHAPQIPPAVSKTLLYFRAVRFGALPAAQEATVYAGFPVEFPWMVQTPLWLDSQPVSGATIERVLVRPNTTSLPPGRYMDTVEVVSQNPSSPEYITVIYEIGTATGIHTPRSASVSGLTLVETYPNPFTGSVAVSFVADRAQDIDLTAYNTLGVAVREVHLEAQAGTNTSSLSGLAPGLYLIELRGRNGTARTIAVGR